MSYHDHGPRCDWQNATEEELKEQAAQYVGFATNEMSDPDDLSWRLENQFPLTDFQFICDWQNYYDGEVLENPRYEEEFSEDEWYNPIIISIEEDGIIIWDGWHRLATSIARGDECIMAVVGE